MKRKLRKVIAVAAVLAVIGNTYAFAAADQVYNFADSYTEDNSRISLTGLKLSVDTEFAGESVIKLQRSDPTTSNGSGVFFTFYGPDTQGRQLSIDNKYAIVDYYYKTASASAQGIKTYFQVDNYYDANGTRLTGIGSSGFLQRENGLILNEWAPMLMPLTDTDSSTVRSDYPGARYGTIRIYPAFQGSAISISTDDVMYVKNAKFYKEKPSNVAYSPKIVFNDGTLEASARLYQLSGATKGAVAVLATYNSDGSELTGCKIEEYTVDELTADAFNNVSLSMQYDITEDSSAKLMLFEDFETMSPLCNASADNYTAPISYGVDNELKYPSWFTAVKTAE